MTGAESIKMSLENLVVPESKEVLKQNKNKIGVISKGSTLMVKAGKSWVIK